MIKQSQQDLPIFHKIVRVCLKNSHVIQPSIKSRSLTVSK